MAAYAPSAHRPLTNDGLLAMYADWYADGRLTLKDFEWRVDALLGLRQAPRLARDLVDAAARAMASADGAVWAALEPAGRDRWLELAEAGLEAARLAEVL